MPYFSSRSEEDFFYRKLPAKKLSNRSEHTLFSRALPQFERWVKQHSLSLGTETVWGGSSCNSQWISAKYLEKSFFHSVPLCEKKKVMSDGKLKHWTLNWMILPVAFLRITIVFLHVPWRSLVKIDEMERCTIDGWS